MYYSYYFGVSDDARFLAWVLLHFFQKYFILTMLKGACHFTLVKSKRAGLGVWAFADIH
jgi:hypothetical protein